MDDFQVELISRFLMLLYASEGLHQSFILHFVQQPPYSFMLQLICFLHLHIMFILSKTLFKKFLQLCLNLLTQNKLPPSYLMLIQSFIIILVTILLDLIIDFLKKYIKKLYFLMLITINFF